MEIVKRGEEEGPLPSKASDCLHVKYYCEENVWKLCEYVKNNRPEKLDACYATFISNPNRTIPIWRQQSHNSEQPVVWDYHVIFIWKYGSNSFVYDLDSTLPFPCEFEVYIKEAIRDNCLLQEEYHRFFRVVEAATYLRHFASDRRHMLDKQGKWMNPPPPHSCIQTDESQDNIQDFISVDPKIGFGKVLTLENFIKHFSLK